MTRAVAEQSHALSIFWLKKHGYLPIDGGSSSTIIKWTGLGNESSVWLTLFINRQGNGWNFTNEEIKKYEIKKQNYIRLYYTHTDRSSGERSEMDYIIELVTTPCNYGGVRYWFICPLSKNGQYCGKRIGVIYMIGKWFGCRHCGNIAYQSQFESEKYKGFVSIPDIEEAEKEVKRYFYRGKPTRKYRKVIRLNKKFEWGIINITARLDKNFAKKYGIEV